MLEANDLFSQKDAGMIYQSFAGMCLLFITLFFETIYAQPTSYSVANAHAHNDYLHPVPFYTAFNSGFGSIEADVFPVGDSLYVAHDRNSIRAGRTLPALYLEPLSHELTISPSRKVTLLIDIKENNSRVLEILTEELKPLRNFLAAPDDTGKPVTILISGERPLPSYYDKYPVWLTFDDDLKLPHTEDQWQRVGQVSLSFKNYSSWNDMGFLPSTDSMTLKHVIDSVHLAGKKIRFWAAPDDVLSWQTQMHLGVDFIGTDKITELKAFLSKNNNGDQ